MIVDIAPLLAVNICQLYNKVYIIYTYVYICLIYVIYT